MCVHILRELFFLRVGSHWGGKGYALSVVDSCFPDMGFTPGENLSVAHPYSLQIELVLDRRYGGQ